MFARYQALEDLVYPVRDVAAGVKNQKWPYVGLEHIGKNTAQLLGRGTPKDATSVNYIFRAGDILFGRLRPNLRKMAQVDFDGYCSTDILVLRCRDGVSARYAALVMSSERVFAAAIRAAEGTKMPRTSWSRIKDVYAPLPAIAEQNKITDGLAGLEAEILQAERAVAKVESIRAGVVREILSDMSNQDGACALFEVSSVERGKFLARPRNDPSYYGGRYGFIQTGDVVRASGGMITHSSQSLNEAGLSVSRLFPEGTVAVTIAAHIGETAILAKSMCFPDSVVGVIANSGFEPRFLEQCISLARPELEARAPQSAQRNINLNDLRPLSVPRASHENQRIFVQVWESFDSRRLQEVAKVDKLRNLKRGLVEDLLKGELGLGINDARWDSAPHAQ